MRRGQGGGGRRGAVGGAAHPGAAGGAASAAGGQQTGADGEEERLGGGSARARQGSGQTGHRRSHADGTPALACWFPQLSHDSVSVLAVLARGSDPPGTPRWPKAALLRRAALALVAKEATSMVLWWPWPCRRG